MKEKLFWMEEYENCHCSFVSEFRKDLPGYCQRHGTNRQFIYKIPKTENIGYAG